MMFKSIIKNRFLITSIICIALGNSWIMPMVLIQPYLYAEYFSPWMLAVIPILYKTSGMLQVVFSKFSLYTNNNLLIVLDIISLINITIFFIYGNGLLFLIVYILEGYLQMTIGEQWGNQFKDYVSKQFPRKNKKFLDAKSFYVSMISIVVSLIVLSVSFYVSKTDYTYALITVMTFCILSTIYQIWFTIYVLKKELQANGCI